jgi:enamine deaminase RidA (YjgF/YER057c/UK114 family)
MEERIRVSSGGKFEDVVGYSRAVRVGRRIYVSGTTATDESGEIVGPEDAYAQAAQTLGNVQRALERMGAGMEHVVRTRMFVTDITRWREFTRAHQQFFAEVRPAATIVEVRALIDPLMLIEIEVDAEI